MIQCNGRYFLSFNHKDLVVSKRNKPACKKIKNCKILQIYRWHFHNFLQIVRRNKWGYAANNMIICSVTQSVQRIFDKKSLHHLVFALCFLHKQLYQTFIHYRRFKFLNGNVRPLKPDKALVTNGRPFKSCSNSTFIMRWQNWSTFLVRAGLFKNFTFETNLKHAN